MAASTIMTTPPTFPRMLDPGEPAPWVRAPLLSVDETFPFEKLGGRHVLLFLFGTAGVPAIERGLAAVRGAVDLFDAERAVFVGVSADPGDVAARRIACAQPGIHFLIDRDRAVSRLYGAAAEGSDAYRPHWLLLDRALRVVARFGMEDAAGAIAAMRVAVAEAPADIAPVLQVPAVLEPALCRHLVELYDLHGGTESGVMRQVEGRTVHVIDHAVKRRADYDIADQAVREAISGRIKRRLVPMIRRAFQFEATRIERYIVACYDAASNGRFNPHRDNTTLGTAHRRFAVTINLNDDYEGGDLRFPEWGPRTYRAPVGGAVVFSCSMLHEATPVTAGRRYATLPFLYDDAAAVIREANLHSLTGDPAPPIAVAR